MVAIACAVCGTIVHRKPSDIARAKHPTCSPACRIARHAQTVAEGRQDAEDRFWSQVTKSYARCWIWTGDRLGHYGRFYVGNRRAVSAHRYAYELARGPIPRGMYVCHHCDNPVCVRPDHLFLGTPKDNAVDMFRKGRARPNKLPPQPPGEEHAMAKLTEDQVRQIRADYKGGESQRSIGKRYGVTRSTIQLIVTGKRWAHVTTPP